ncbi:MAG: hypothetical protein A3G52_04310 [Candidatus Taylorbacteria bacterium RIFCSPLOWO2_12_FULL_43_20]|uniref:Uncharacterized protein n=1 Tax=Candidatus Taylorbacteria bacterium RIFCSPLOWO2_12_FULL_43_20 TaxID=1802332 RepID=A0A1G2P221_9BACT|nr:MAG: hypothetical protein A3H58_03480 [Candidatus Taylorbacteria bacterium RIFCSPLOWO2_02_FULL_43_22b]OHA41662.1 MAG: hypothetical protein A3G52_04310 [Candidatus Taylorbacteria bacterium RIFCSPLOWO2_12_FULL_43_20]
MVQLLHHPEELEGEISSSPLLPPFLKEVVVDRRISPHQQILNLKLIIILKFKITNLKFMNKL